MTIQEMIARQQAIVSGARAAGRDLTAEERAEFDGLQRQIDAAGNNPAQGAEGQGGEDPTGGARGMGNDNMVAKSKYYSCKDFYIYTQNE